MTEINESNEVVEVTNQVEEISSEAKEALENVANQLNEKIQHESGKAFALGAGAAGLFVGLVYASYRIVKHFHDKKVIETAEEVVEALDKVEEKQETVETE